MTKQISYFLLILLVFCVLATPSLAGIRSDHPRIFVNTDPAYYNCVDSLRLRVWQQPWRTEYEKLRMWRNSFSDVPRGRKPANVLPSFAIRWLIDPTETAAADTALAMMLALEDNDGQAWNLSVVSIAYDWLYGYPAFSAEDRQSVRERMERWTREVIHQLKTDDDVFNNHTWYHLRSVYLAALALYGESEEAVAWLEFAGRYWENKLSGAVKLFDGGWHEGLSYSSRASYNNLGMWLAALQSATSPREWPFARLRQQGGDWLNKFTRFYAAQVYPDGTLARYGDIPEFILGGGWDNSRLFMIVAREYRSGLAAWIVQNAARPGQELLPLHVWYYLLWYDPAVTPVPPAETTGRSVRLNPGTYDLFFMRSGWDKDATVVSFHAGDWFGSHNHLDAGHFSIFRRQWLALDAGAYAPMNGSHFVNFAHRTLAHNSLLIYDPEERFQVPHGEGVTVINDGGQREIVSLGGRSTQNNFDVGVWRSNRLGGAHFERSTVLHWYAGDSIDFIAADITLAYNSDIFSAYGRDFRNRPKVEKVVRSLVYVRPSTVIVYDRVTTKDPSFTKTWTLNTAHQPYLGELGTFLVENGNSRLAGRTFLPPDPDREIWGSHAQPFRFLGVDMHPGLDLWNYPEVEPGGWVLRISQTEQNTYGEFLHVLVAGDNDRTSQDLLAGWAIIDGRGLRGLRNGGLVLAFLDDTELSPRLLLPPETEPASKVYLLGVPEGVTYQLSVGERTIEGVRALNGVVAVEADGGVVVELKP
ncbi:MAG: DUF4962 domain-containing protein [Candidatus Glassbacteria bacterium]|nr:DUF4962 domain-containing protein [Candidatus Glassbacteria bacterium]